MSYLKYLKNITLLLFTSLLLSSCATQVKSLKKDKDLVIDADEGYLFMSVDTSMDLHKILITGKKTIVLTKDDLQRGTSYILVKLPAGEYTIDKVFSGRSTQFILDDNLWEFKVSPQVISYIGNLKVSHRNWGFSAYFELNNHSSYALEYIEKEFPKILSSRKIEYSGPGKDRFFDLVRSKNKDKPKKKLSKKTNSDKKEAQL